MRANAVSWSNRSCTKPRLNWLREHPRLRHRNRNGELVGSTQMNLLDRHCVVRTMLPSLIRSKFGSRGANPRIESAQAERLCSQTKGTGIAHDEKVRTLPLRLGLRYRWCFRPKPSPLFATAGACSRPANFRPTATQLPHGFGVDDWLKTSVPSTVLAAQAAAGAVPDPYFGITCARFRARAIPSATTFPTCRCRRTVLIAAAGGIATSSPRRRTAESARIWLHFGGINYRGGDLAQRPQGRRLRPQVAGAYRTYDFDVTEFLKPGKTNVLAVETFAPTEKDLGINWVDWNPMPAGQGYGPVGRGRSGRNRRGHFALAAGRHAFHRATLSTPPT